MYPREVRSNGIDWDLYLEGEIVGRSDHPVTGLAILNDMVYDQLARGYWPTSYELGQDRHETAQAYADSLLFADSPTDRLQLLWEMTPAMRQEVAAELAARKMAKGEPMTPDMAYQRLTTWMDTAGRPRA